MSVPRNVYRVRQSSFASRCIATRALRGREKLARFASYILCIVDQRPLFKLKIFLLAPSTNKRGTSNWVDYGTKLWLLSKILESLYRETVRYLGYRWQHSWLIFEKHYVNCLSVHASLFIIFNIVTNKYITQ